MTKKNKGVTWGVMFHDGSVMARWSGRTEEQRAREAAQEYAKTYQPDHITLAHWNGDHWERAE